MQTYKGYTIWHNSLQGWMIQSGYDVLKVCATNGAAKAWITKGINKGVLD